MSSETETSRVVYLLQHIRTISQTVSEVTSDSQIIGNISIVDIFKHETSGLFGDLDWIIIFV